MFGLDGLFSGIMNIAGSALQNQGAMERQNDANRFNAQQSQIGRDFSAQQASISRDYNSAEAAVGRDYNALEAQKSRDFSADQAATANALTEKLQSQAMDYNSAEAAKSRAFTEQMSSTAYQRSAADMQKAGLNRILAVGSPSSTPSGASGSVGGGSGTAGGGATASSGSASTGIAGASNTAAAHAAPTANLISGAMSSALEYEKLKPQIDLIKQQANLNTAQTKVQENVQSSVAQDIALKQKDNQIKLEELKVAKRKGFEAEKATDFYNENPKLAAGLRTANTIANDVAPVVSTAKQFMGLTSQRPF